MDKEKRNKRIQQKQRHIERQVSLLKDQGLKDMVPENHHRLHKKHALNCGNPVCVLCMNPRKAFGEKTLQEKKFEAVAIDE